MDKKDLIPGKTYLHKHDVVVHGKYGSRKTGAEGFIECEEVYPGGASFFQGGNKLELSDERIEKEVWEDGRKES